MPFCLNCGSLVVIILDAVSMLLYMCYWLHCIIGGGVGGGCLWPSNFSVSHMGETATGNSLLQQLQGEMIKE